MSDLYKPAIKQLESRPIEAEGLSIRVKEYMESEEFEFIPPELPEICPDGIYILLPKPSKKGVTIASPCRPYCDEQVARVLYLATQQAVLEAKKELISNLQVGLGPYARPIDDVYYLPHSYTEDHAVRVIDMLGELNQQLKDLEGLCQ
jgi:hypothetical protein